MISNHVWIISPSQANTVFDHPQLTHEKTNSNALNSDEIESRLESRLNDFARSNKLKGASKYIEKTVFEFFL